MYNIEYLCALYYILCSAVDTQNIDRSTSIGENNTSVHKYGIHYFNVVPRNHSSDLLLWFTNPDRIHPCIF